MRHAAAVALAVTFAALGAAPAGAHDKTIALRMASTFPGGMALIGEGAGRLAQKIARATGGEFVIQPHEPGVLVPAAESVSAAAEGKVEAAWGGAGWFAERDSAFNMFSAVPFGPGLGEYLAWMYRGGGLEEARGLFHAHGLHNVPCAIIPPEASGWFRKEITKVEDLRGLRMRFFGLGAKVMQRLGAETLQLPPGEILKALQSEAIDAAEFSLPAMDQKFGFDSVARYYYFPGWHQQATFFDLYVNKAVWDGLADRHKVVAELACGDSMRQTIAEGEAAQGKAIAEMRGRGVQVRRWAPEILLAFETAWKQVAAEESARNANFARIYESYSQFRASYAVWSYLGYLQ